MYLGFTILEVSKHFMYATYYDILQQFFCQKKHLHYVDCDSFVLSIETNDLVKELITLQEAKNSFDFNKLDKNHPVHCNRNRNVIGKKN